MSKTGQKWKHSLSKRHDQIVRLLGMPERAILNNDFEVNVRRWLKDGLESKLRYEYDLCPEDTVLDLGGFEGSWSAEIMARYGCRIHVFEPVLDYYQAIYERFARNSLVQAHPYGLADATGKTSFGMQGDATGMWKGSEEVVEVELKDVADFLEEFNIAKVALCKINIEGAEYDLLERMLDAGLINCFRNLQIQFHSFVPGATERMEAIHRRLLHTHELTYQYRFVWENWRLKTAQAIAA